MGRWELWGWGRMGYQKVLGLLCLAALPGGLECGGMRRGRGLSWPHPIFCQSLSILYGYIMVIAQYDAAYCVPRDRNSIAHSIYLSIPIPTSNPKMYTYRRTFLTTNPPPSLTPSPTPLSTAPYYTFHHITNTHSRLGKSANPPAAQHSLLFMI